MALFLILGYQNCAGQINQNSYSKTPKTPDSPNKPNSIDEDRKDTPYTPTVFNPFDLDPACVNSSYTTILQVDDPVSIIDNSGTKAQDEYVGTANFNRAYVSAGKSTTDYDAPIELVIDDSIYNSDPTKPEVGDRYKELIEDAITMWEEGIGKDIFNIVETPTTITSERSISKDGYSTIYWNQNDNIGDRVRQASGFACAAYTSTGTFVESDIVINDFRESSSVVATFFFDCFANGDITCAVPNSAVQQAFDRNIGIFRANGGRRYRAAHFVTIMAHELGHALGLRHSVGDEKSIMKTPIISLEVISKLSQGDIEKYNTLKKGVRLIDL